MKTTHTLQALPNQTLAYTDGACRGNPGKGGYGAVIILPNGEQVDICGGEMSTTNNRMELLGAIHAVEYSPVNLPLQIWSDSSYVINGITKWMTGWKKKNFKNIKNPELWQRLEKACQNRQIDWQWVKGHAGHEGNEYADRLANRGIDNLPNAFEKRLIKSATPLLPPDNLTSAATVSQLTEPPMLKDNDNISSTVPNFDLTDGFYQVEDFANQDADAFLSFLDDRLPDNEPTFVSYSAQHTPQADFSAFVDSKGNFVPQDEILIARRPQFDGNTTQPNASFVPLLPRAKHQGMANRQLILDTETTGFDPQNGDRIIEVGVVELINRKFTGEKLHVYLNPHKAMDQDVIKVHGIHNAFLDGMPNFEQVGKILYDFLSGAELIAHNAGFDMGFLHAEFSRMGLPEISQHVTVTDSLALAKQLYAGQRNTLDALVKRLDVGKQDRTFHGALLDAEILAEVYLAMTGGQVALAINDMAEGGIGGMVEHRRFNMPVARCIASTQDEAAHLSWLTSLASKHPQLAAQWGIELADLPGS